jgi:hypothetical protein
MSTACGIPKATNTPSEYTVLFFSWKHWLFNVPQCYVIQAGLVMCQGYVLEKFCTNQTPCSHLPYILKYNLHPFYSFRRLKNQMRITIACGLDSWSRAGFWKNDTAAVSTVRTIIIYYFKYYLLL